MIVAHRAHCYFPACRCDVGHIVALYVGEATCGFISVSESYGSKFHGVAGFFVCYMHTQLHGKTGHACCCENQNERCGAPKI